MSKSKSIRNKAAKRAFAAVALALTAATPAYAHGFGQRYDLPLPFTLYLYGTAAAIVVSFLIVGLFVRRRAPGRTRARIDLLAFPVSRWLAYAIPALRLLAIFILVVTILAGFFGDQSPYRNIAPTLIWIVFWVGLAFVSALIGNVWDLFNPWRAIFDWTEVICRRFGNAELSFALPYPRRLGVWPAFLLLLGFCWTELVDPSAAIPAHLAGLIAIYSAFTFLGMLTFGREPWLRHGEVFTVVFGLFARFAPTEMRCAPAGGKWELRAFGAGLSESEPASPSMTALVLLILSTVLYDGLLATPEWSSLEGALRALLPDAGEHFSMILKTAGLGAFWLVFFSAYWAVSAMMSVAADGSVSAARLAHSFVFTLIPIAIGYHVAHYLVFLLLQGQYIIPLASDPFGYGWNVLGTSGYRVEIAAVGARFEWYAAVLAIVLGHIAAVYLAHVRAMQVFERRGTALRSQVPLTALMVIYTFISLTILAEPIVNAGAPAQPSAVASSAIAIPNDAVLPDPATGQLKAVEPGQSARAKLTFRVLGSPFHDGTRMSVADILYSYVFAYRWGVPLEGDAAHYDPAVDAATAQVRHSLAGLRVLATDMTSKTFRVGDVNFVRELFVVEVYATIAPDDPDRDGLVAPPWSTLPWHLVALMEEAVARGIAAFSQAEAARRGLPWLDLVRSDETGRKLDALAAEFERSGYRPAALRSLVSEDAARRRWTALRAFYKERGHFLVTNGAYRVKAWSADTVTLEAFRDLNYPLGVGSYDTYAIPRRGFITNVEWNGAKVRLFGEIEIINKFQRSYRLVRTPMQTIAPVVRDRAAPECRYVVIDGADRVVLTGVQKLADDATFQIDFGGRLAPGRYTMFALIAPNENVMNADIRRIPVVINP